MLSCISYPRLRLSPLSLSFAMASPATLKRNADHLSTSAADNKKSKANSSITSFFGAPKTKPVESKPATLPTSFNKDKWMASLNEEQRELLQLEIDTLDDSWLAQLKDEVVTPEFLALKRFLKKEKDSGAKIFPPENEIYSWCGTSANILSLDSLTYTTQVTPYAAAHREGRSCWSGSISQP